MDLDNYTPISFRVESDDEAEKKEDEEFAKVTKNKKKKNEFYGIKTRKASAYSGARNRLTWEIFNILKEPEVKMDEYVQEVFWFNPRERKVVNSKKMKEYGVLMHGPYRRELNGVILEEGIFYQGMKHGRWMTYDRKGILINKRKYYRGWAKDSHVSFYNQEKGTIKEVIQIHYKQADGPYFKFYKTGQMAVSGAYKFGGKVGVWTEYYPTDKKGRRIRKRRINYGKDSFDKNFKPFIEREWSMSGKLIYDARKKSR